MNPRLKALLETAKMALRLVIFWSPVLLAFLVDIDQKGLIVALSTLLTTGDKYIHSNKEIKVNGLLPF